MKLGAFATASLALFAFAGCFGSDGSDAAGSGATGGASAGASGGTSAGSPGGGTGGGNTSTAGASATGGAGGMGGNGGAAGGAGTGGNCGGSCTTDGACCEIVQESGPDYFMCDGGAWTPVSMFPDPAEECPTMRPSEGDACTPFGPGCPPLRCDYVDCEPLRRGGPGLFAVECDGNQWTSNRYQDCSKCGTLEAGEYCAADEICVVTIAGNLRDANAARTYTCEKNPCSAQDEPSCACGASVCDAGHKCADGIDHLNCTL